MLHVECLEASVTGPKSEYSDPQSVWWLRTVSFALVQLARDNYT